jgi:Ca-activated chloride channel family protein
MEANVSFDRTLVAVQVDDTVHVMLELTAPAAPEAQRRPLDLVLVLDRSGSMAGDPLDAVKAATQQLLRRLGADDRLAVVAFDDTAQLVLGLQHHDADAACDRVDRIDDGGSTNLSGGWLKALEIVRAQGRADALRRIVLLSDGHANVGITDPEALAALAASANVDGLSTSTIGFDDGYDEVLLAAIADAGAGNDYFCGGPDQAPAVFAAEFEGLLSVVAQNVSVELRPTEVVTDWGVLNEFPIVHVDGGMQVQLGDAYGGERRRVVAALQLAPQTSTGPITVGQMVLRWASVVGQVALHTVTIPLVIGVTDEPLDATVVNAEVVEQVDVLKAAAERRKADEAMRRGDLGGAAVSFRIAASMLSSRSSFDEYDDEVSELLADADRLEAGDIDPNMVKRQHSLRRQSMKGRKKRFDS